MIAPPCHSRNEATSDDWITPKWLLDRIGSFDLDPCASQTQPWPTAYEMWTIRDNGLIRPWGAALVYCNPPYGKSMAEWLNKCALHGNAIALVFARTETRAFFAHVWPYASALLFLRGRLTFAYPNGSLPRHGHNSGGPSVLIAYGDIARRRLESVADLGALVIPQR